MNYGHLLKKQKRCLPDELEAGDCWIALSLAQLSGLILSGRVGKHTDSKGAGVSRQYRRQDQTDCQEWDTDDWEGYQRVLPEEVDHYISFRLDATLGENQRYYAPTDRTLASTAKQVREVVEPDESYPKTSH